jgi:hypothetical protein
VQNWKFVKAIEVYRQHCFVGQQQFGKCRQAGVDAVTRRGAAVVIATLSTTPAGTYRITVV